ncbi:acetate/propionate family kinase [bacterium]|nr:acetate/propionate family kinase [bacterium]
MNILIANPGSTSYKCKLISMPDEDILFQAVVERIGDEEGLISYQFAGKEKVSETRAVPDYFKAVHLTLELLQQFCEINTVSAVGFKTVHARGVSGCAALTDDVLRAMEEYMPLVPVHNQVYLTAISVFQKLLPQIPLVGLFETAFHTEIPPEAYLYGIPYRYYEDYGVRKYGFHGASHRYIAEWVKKQYAQGSKTYKLISCHLGGSSSVCAIKDGVSIDTSMGMSAQCGLLNAKRVGDLDSFALLYIMEKENLSIGQMREILISQSGVYGISGLSGDFRDIEEAMHKGGKQAEYAFKTFAYVVKRYIGEYVAILNGTDYIVFTGGLGQNSPAMRSEILSNMENIGMILDTVKNNENPREGIISSSTSPIKIMVMQTNEEIVVAREVEKFIRAQTA